MTEGITWIEGLQIDPEQIPRQGLAGIYGSALFRTLKKGIVASEAYLNWAKSHYDLAVLKPDFFSVQHEQRDLIWRKWGKLHEWNPELIPVAEWDGVLFVAGLEPMEHLPTSVPIQMLLAPWYLIEAEFYRLNPEAGQKSARESDLPENFFDDEESSIEMTNTSITQLTGHLKRLEKPADFQEHEARIQHKAQQHEFKNITTLGQSSPLAKIALHYFDRLSPIFEHAALLEPVERSLKVTAWDPKWAPQVNLQKFSIDSGEPSIFRIAARTQKPFHGKVAMNAVNRSFFTVFYESTPDPIFTTVVPVINPQRQSVAYLLACTETPFKDDDEALALVQIIAKKIGAKLKRSA